MAKVRVFEAATEGFRLIRREPKAVLAWSGLVFLCAGLPVSLFFQNLAHDFAASGAADAGLSPLSILWLFPFLWLAGMVLFIALVGAVLRAVLAPGDRRFVYLRLSKAEMWMTLSTVVGAILLMIIYFIGILLLTFALMLPLSVLSAAVDGALSTVHWALVFAIIPSYLALLYFAARFGIGTIISFEQRRFALFESWNLTAGQGWRLVGLALLLTLFTWIVEWVLMLILFGGALSVLFQPANDPAAEAALAERLLAVGASPMIWLIGLIGCALAGPFVAVIYAPWARAYQMLRDTAAAQA